MFIVFGGAGLVIFIILGMSGMIFADDSAFDELLSFGLFDFCEGVEVHFVGFVFQPLLIILHDGNFYK